MKATAGVKFKDRSRNRENWESRTRIIRGSSNPQRQREGRSDEKELIIILKSDKSINHVIQAWARRKGGNYEFKLMDAAYLKNLNR